MIYFVTWERKSYPKNIDGGDIEKKIDSNINVNISFKMIKT